MFCTKCGVKLNDEAKFCHKCGNFLTNTTQISETNTGYQSNTVPINLPKKPLNILAIIASVSVILYFLYFFLFRWSIISFYKYNIEILLNLNKLNFDYYFTFLEAVVSTILSFAILLLLLNNIVNIILGCINLKFTPLIEKIVMLLNTSFLFLNLISPFYASGIIIGVHVYRDIFLNALMVIIAILNIAALVFSFVMQKNKNQNQT